MEILTTRTLRYTDQAGEAKQVVLSIFVPYEKEQGHWRCKYLFSAPFDRKNVDIAGADFIQTLLLCLATVPEALRLELGSRASWQGMSDCGLPQCAQAARPAFSLPPDIPPLEKTTRRLETLTKRVLGSPDEAGLEHALLLTIYKPFQVDDDAWKCAFSFGPSESALVRFGVGADFVEAFLDALALARIAYEATVPNGWKASESEGLFDCADFPYKIGRSYWTDTVGDLGPGAPDFTPSWQRKTT